MFKASSESVRAAARLNAPTLFDADVNPAGPGPTAAQLMPDLYARLRELARARMARLPAGQTLQPTALVHEAFARVASGPVLAWDGQRHFFFAAARAMRDVLVELARAKAGPKRGGDRRRVPLSADLPAGRTAWGGSGGDVLAIREALAELAGSDPLKARLVELRYTAGMTIDEAAAVLGESPRTLHRHWRFTRAWLQVRLA